LEEANGKDGSANAAESGSRNLELESLISVMESLDSDKENGFTDL